MKTEPDRRPDSQGDTMQRLLDATGIDPTAPKPTMFTLESPLPEQGNDRTYMAHTDKMWVFLNVYAPDSGENDLHSHINEDHAFIVLQGRAKFKGPKGEVAELRPNQGMMLPRGTLYGFTATGGEALVMLRIGCHVDPSKSPWGRTDGEGTPYVGSVRQHQGAVETVFKPGSFFR